MNVLEKLMSIFESFNIEKLGKMLPSAESLMNGLPKWMVLLVLAGPVLLLGFGIYYLFFAPKEANHTIGYRFFYAMSRVEVWQHTQRLAGLAYSVLGGVLLLIIGIISIRFGKMAPPDMVWLAVKCLLWEIVLTVIATLAVDILIVVLYDYNGDPRNPNGKAMNAKKTRNSQRNRRQAPTGTRKR